MASRVIRNKALIATLEQPVHSNYSIDCEVHILQVKSFPSTRWYKFPEEYNQETGWPSTTIFSFSNTKI